MRCSCSAVRRSTRPTVPASHVTSVGTPPSRTRSCGPHGDLVHPVEIARRVYQPVQQYALVESALAAAAGRTVEEQERHVARLWADGSSAVEGRDDSWRTVALTETRSSRTGSWRRRTVAWWSVRGRWTRRWPSSSPQRRRQPRGASPSRTWSDWWVRHHRPRGPACCGPPPPRRVPAFRLGAEAIEASSGVHPSEADVLDLYSCFPSAVQIAARDLVSMAAGGPRPVAWRRSGPVQQLRAARDRGVADELRTGRASVAATTCVSGLLSKAGVGVVVPRTGPAVLHDVTDADRQAREQVRWTTTSRTARRSWRPPCARVRTARRRPSRSSRPPMAVAGLVVRE